MEEEKRGPLSGFEVPTSFVRNSHHEATQRIVGKEIVAPDYRRVEFASVHEILPLDGQF